MNNPYTIDSACSEISKLITLDNSEAVHALNFLKCRALEADFYKWIPLSSVQPPPKIKGYVVLVDNFRLSVDSWVDNSFSKHDGVTHWMYPPRYPVLPRANNKK